MCVLDSWYYEEIPNLEPATYILLKSVASTNIEKCLTRCGNDKNKENCTTTWYNKFAGTCFLHSRKSGTVTRASTYNVNSTQMEFRRPGLFN